MKLSSPPTTLLIILLINQTLIPCIADRQFILNTCKRTPFPNLCLQILLQNSKSQNTDLTGLALIGVDAVNHKGQEILLQINDLKHSRPELVHALDYCSEVYHAVVDADVPSSKQALQGGQPKFAEDGMADSAVESQACEGGFGEHGQASPMTDSNKDMNDVANVVRAIIRMLL